ncbi:hypothetical protein DEIPH_ctg025orf0269 [Deinococcus phoenicis]|uniref:PatA-like N-terminal domain-containing protein n=1 Tax=Deinococcus phoenicis TaxID=1476583 RepID=A0A016QQV6_9DEIO|nr:DUF4388 domain-containing protein [Deinococcus phoenicis]EYB68381.1 hypothetical protein DEIPH_ctg025orf0269 [Deinococcus phoenicis]
MTPPTARPTTSLDAFDLLELLRLLAERGRSGVFQVDHPDGQFQLWLEGGRVRHLHFGGHWGEARGAAALARLLATPTGRFHFEEGHRHPCPGLDTNLDETVLEALEALPPGELKFGGPARITSPERVARLGWTEGQRDVLRQIAAGRPLADLAQEPNAWRLIVQLSRLRLLVPRRPRIARLTVAVLRADRDRREEPETAVARIDDLIFHRWQDELGRPLTQVAVRDPSGKVVTLPVRGRAELGPRLLLPPERLLSARLRAGDSVQVQPV